MSRLRVKYFLMPSVFFAEFAEMLRPKMRDWDQLCVQDGLLGNSESDTVQSQVQRLILQACSHENLCQSYIGWCPFW